MMSTTDAVLDTVQNDKALSELLRHHKLYELVDPLISDPGFGDANGWQDCEYIANPFFDHPRAQRLRLQPVKGSPASVWAKLQAHCKPPLPQPDEPRPICGWLISQQPMVSLARYMSRQMQQKKPSGRRALLRYYDPRVMQRLASILSVSQLAALLGPTEHWLFISHAGDLRVISPHADSRHAGQLSLAEAQWQAIERIGLVNRTLASCAKLTDIKALDDDDIANIDHLVAVAEHEGLDDPASRMTFALHGLGSSANFYRHPDVQRVLVRCRQGEDYRKLTQDWHRETWQRIVTDTREVSV